MARVSMKYPTLAKYRIMLFTVKCCDLMHFLSFPGKLLVTLPISGTLYSNIHGKTWAVRKQSAKTMKLLPQNKSNIVVSWDYKNTSGMHPLVRYTNTTKYPGIPWHSRDLPWLGVLLMAKYPKNYQDTCYVPMATLRQWWPYFGQQVL